MKNNRNKIVTTISLVLLLAISTMAALTLTSNAETYMASYPSAIFLDVSPNPIGVGQTVSVVFWLADSPPSHANYVGWKGITIEITKPDKTVETEAASETDDIGAGYINYTPETNGTYKFKAIFPGQEINIVGSSFGFPDGLYYYEPDESRVVELTVQEEQVQMTPETPLPEGYWTRPITAENRAWSEISGNWLASGGLGATTYNEYTTAPESAHIMWTKPLSFGGIADGELGWGKAYYNGIVYEPLFTPPVIISGRVYYNMFASGMGATSKPGVICVDLRTGEEIWKNEDMPAISRGQVFNFEGGSHHGASAYLWSTSGPSWQMFDAFTGRLLVTLENTTSETAAYGSIAAGSGKFDYGPNGELLMYILDGASNRLTMWNSTLAMLTSASSWSPSGTFDWTRGIQWSVEVPDVPGAQTMSLLDYDTGVIIAESTIAAPTFIHIGYSMTTGEQLWVQNRTGYGYGFSGATMPPGLLSMFSPCRTLNDGVYTFFYKEGQQFVAFDAKTGNFLWKTESLSKFTNSDFSMYDWAPRIAYGKLYVTGYTGSVSAFDLETGKHLWTHLQGSSGFDTPYGSWSCIDGVVPADNKIYVPCMEHTPQTPMYQGYTLYCLDAETGDFLWKIPAFLTSVAVADGYIVGANGYDQQIYCYGKGPSAITVSAPDIALTLGDSVVIKGMVTDISSGAEQVAARFPSGLPAVSNGSMTGWMEYVYMQKAVPSDAVGVEVSVDVLDENGNYRNIGTVTSDASGFYSLMWEPDVPGQYTVYATFAGSEAYYSSFAETSFGVVDAPVEPAPEYPQPIDNSMLIIAGVAAILVAVIVVGALMLLMLRKR